MATVGKAPGRTGKKVTVFHLEVITPLANAGALLRRIFLFIPCAALICLDKGFPRGLHGIGIG
jgi:hypothetical protein